MDLTIVQVNIYLAMIEQRYLNELEAQQKAKLDYQNKRR
jgi:hypothetical protein